MTVFFPHRGIAGDWHVCTRDADGAIVSHREGLTEWQARAECAWPDPFLSGLLRGMVRQRALRMELACIIAREDLTIEHDGRYSR